MWSYLLRCRLQKRPHLLKKNQKKNPRCHDLPLRTGTDRNGPERTYENTETDLFGYRNGPERTSVGTETDRNRLLRIPKRTSMGTRNGRVRYDRKDPNKVMYVLVGRYIGR